MMFPFIMCVPHSPTSRISLTRSGVRCPVCEVGPELSRCVRGLGARIYVYFPLGPAFPIAPFFPTSRRPEIRFVLAREKETRFSRPK
jgi:hypothetical protein